MHELIVPSEVRFSEIKKNGSLSPNNYKKLTIKNPSRHKVSFYLVILFLLKFKIICFKWEIILLKNV